MLTLHKIPIPWFSHALKLSGTQQKGKNSSKENHNPAKKFPVHAPVCQVESVRARSGSTSHPLCPSCPGLICCRTSSPSKSWPWWGCRHCPAAGTCCSFLAWVHSSCGCAPRARHTFGKAVWAHLPETQEEHISCSQTGSLVKYPLLESFPKLCSTGWLWW